MRGVRVGTGIFAGLMVLLAVLSTAAWAQTFRVDWGPRAYGIRPSIEGYVYNDSLYWVSNVRLRIEGLDTEQRPVGERYVWTFGDIAPSNRVYFVAKSVGGAATYRISVASYDLVSMGGP